MSDYDSSDSELSRAIALSLQDANKSEVISLISDTEDDDVSALTMRRTHIESEPLERVGPSSREASSGITHFHHTGHEEEVGLGGRGDTTQMPNSHMVNASLALQASSDLSGIAGMNRREMEEQRLERARKRKAASISPPPLGRRAAQYPQSSPTATGGEIESDRRHAKKTNTYKQSVLEPSVSKEERSSWSGQSSTREAKTFLIPHHLGEEKHVASTESGLKSRGNGLETTSSKELNAAALPNVLSYRQQLEMLTPGIHFPNGTVKKTWAYGYPREDDIKIEEVLQKDDLELAVLSAFQWDEEWILRKLNMRKTKVICVVQAESDEQKAEMRANVPPNIRFCFPSMAGQINCMHSKLQLLSHPTHLRVVVPSANLVPYDWGEEGGVMENTLFIIDLPRFQDEQKTALAEITPFGRELLHFLRAMDMERTVIDSILDFDFSRTSHLAFIHSIGGSHSGREWKRTGYCGLGSAIQELGLATKQRLDIVFVTASMGNLNDDFIRSIYLAAQGDDGTTELNWRLKRAPKSKTSSLQAKVHLEKSELLVSQAVDKGFRIYFPSRETVANSRGGVGAGGTICLQKHWYDSPTFPRSLMRDCKSQRPRLLMHNKMLFVRSHKPVEVGVGEENKECVAWAYIGSANLSESAWGRLVKDRITKQPKLNIRNWECGVVVPVPGLIHDTSGTGTKGKGKSVDNTANGFESEPPGMEIFDGVIPVPIVFPGEEYGRKRPWLYAER